MVKVNEIENFKTYGRCVSISNGKIEALITIEMGPRIIFFGFSGGRNLMCTDREGLGYKDDGNYAEFFGEGRKWESFGGHRIWLSPESYPETYTPDDKPVSYEIIQNGAVFIPEADKEIGAAKTLQIKMSESGYDMTVNMRVKNISSAPKKFAVWSLSVCAAGGTIIIPMNTNDTGLLHNRTISVWPYTDMRDSRIYWGGKYITLKQDKTAIDPIKLGFDLNCGTAYYVLGNEILKKNYSTNHPDGIYPDGGCSFETYTNKVMLEFETLSELKTVSPGEANELTEHWTLCRYDGSADLRNDESIAEMLGKL